MYWLTSNVFSLTQFMVLKIPFVKKTLAIPPIIHHEPNPNAKSEGFFATIKAQYNSQLEKAKEEARIQQIEKQRKSRMAAGPPIISSNKTHKK